MSDDSTTADDQSYSNKASRPQTVSLTKVRSKNNSFDKNTSIGEAFLQQNDENDDNLTPKIQDINSHKNLDHNNTENGNNSPKSRPKTVTKHRTDGYQQRLVDLGAIGSNNICPDQALSPQHFSPKPNSEKCYICGKEFLISSLKIHEKQCAKKHEKDKHDTKLNNKTSSVTKVGKKPQLEACYLCGKEFFIHSLGIHETQCIKNWKANKTPDAKDQPVAEKTMAGKQCNDEQRRNVPAQKSTKKEAIQTQNASPKSEKKSDSSSVRQKGLKTMPCYVCGLAFLPHSLKIHEKKCQKKDQMKSTMVEKDDALLNFAIAADNSTLEQTDESQIVMNPENSNTSNSSNTYTSPKKPKTIVCRTCGQEFLKSSYVFHEKKCIHTAQNAEEKETTYQSKASQISSKNSQKPRTIVCYICGQEFLKSSYAFHEKKCADKKVESECQNEETTSNLTYKEKQLSNVQTERPETPRRKPKTKACYICGKEMLLSSLKVHEQQCQKKTDILKNINHQKSPAQKRQGGSARIKLEAKPKTQVCYLCGETFLFSSIKVHEAQCEKRWSGKT